jgi:tetratricopeptide (TPR) repeat protein
MYRHNTEKIFKWVFSLFAFIFPFFFLPQIDTNQILTEKALLVFFAFIFIVIQLIDILISKRLSFNLTWIKKIGLSLLSCFIFSALFSKNISLSFWGKINESSDLLILISSFIIFFAASSLKRRDIINILEYFVAGSAVLSIIFLIQKFANIKIALFGAPEASATLISIAFITVICFFFNNLRYFRSGHGYNLIKIFSMGIFLILFCVSLLLIGYKLAWLFMAAGVFFIFWRSMIEGKFNIKRKKSIFSLLLLLVFFSFFFLPSIFEKKSFEPKLSYSKSWDVAINTLKESPKNFIFGSGLNTFSYDYSLYKGKDMGITGNVIFKEGAFPFLSVATTTGISGAILVLIFLVLFYKHGFSYFINYKKENGDSSINVRDLIFPVVFCVSLLLFFYKIDSVFLFLVFFFFGLWDSQQKGEEKNIEIPVSFLKSVFCIIIVILFIGLFNFVNYYRAGVFYEKSINSFKNQEYVDESINYMQKSSDSWKSSNSCIGLSQLYLIKAGEELKAKWTTKERKEEQRNNIEEFSQKSEESAICSCVIDPYNFESWQNLGLVYENINLIKDDRTDDAIQAYERAIILSPYNSDIYLSLGRVYEASDDDENALIQYEKAFELNPLNDGLLKKIKTLRSGQKIN